MECNLFTTWYSPDGYGYYCKAGFTGRVYKPTDNEYSRYCTGVFRECPRLMTYIDCAQLNINRRFTDD